jgi:hypothetical protein
VCSSDLAAAWYRYRSSAGAQRPGLRQRLAEAMADLPAYFNAHALQDKDFVPVQSIKSIAVWDTVGALGLPAYHDQRRIDTYGFVDNRLSPKVERGFHAVALDEQRDDFSPSLWEPAANLEQVLFPGAHADVGGGYTTHNGESGLSNGALLWMVERLRGLGVRFATGLEQLYQPEPCGTAHEPWQHPPFNLPDRVHTRHFENKGLTEHGSLAQRMQCGAVVPEPGRNPVSYRPPNRP